MAFHNGDLGIKLRYEAMMKKEYGKMWEDDLMLMMQMSEHKTGKGWKEYIKEQVIKYK